MCPTRPIKYVVIGGGIAGTTAAETLRKLDETADITLIDAESHPLYSRVLLRNVVKGQIERDRVFMKKPTWYAEKNIEWLPETRVVRIDPTHQFVATDSGREFLYDKLLIASGGDVRLISEDKRGVSYFRTLDDTDHLVQLLKGVLAINKGERHGVTLGSSFIALDYINIFARYNIPQTVLMRGNGFWTKSVSLETSDMLIRHCEEKGVRFIRNVDDIELVGETELAGVRLPNGDKIACQILGVGIGITPDWELFEAAGIAVQEGILCNEYLETSLKNVYTAGDVAQFDDVAVSRSRVVGNWLNALSQARVAAENMTGGKKAFELVSSYTTELLGLEMAFVGDVSRPHADEVRTIERTDKTAIEIFDRGGKTVGAVLIGDVKPRQAITNAIKNSTLFSSSP